MPPIDFCNFTISTCGQPNRIWTLLVLAGTETLISFLFFLTTLLLRAVVSGELRFSRSFVSAPVLVLPSCPGLPNRDASSIAPPSRLASRCIARINVHRSKDRVKDASSIDHMQRALDSCLRGVRTLCGARLTNVPLLGVASDIRCHRRAFTAGGYPL